MYVRKRMTKGEARRAAGARHLRLVKKEELSQAVAGCDLDPSLLRQGKERLFEERWYRHVFPTADPKYYLPRYWLLREVGYAARGYPERAYAKWLVLNFVWAILEPLCRGRSGAETFWLACERDDGNVVSPLLRAIAAVFKAALRFFRAKRGTGEMAIDVSSFFRRRNLHKEFARYWRGSRNDARGAFAVAWRNFERAFALERAA